MLIILLQAISWLWRLFISNPGPRNAEATAKSWFYLSLIIAFVGAVLIFGFKSLRKAIETNKGEKIWKRAETWQLITLGLLPIYTAMAVTWLMQDDYYQIVQFPGLAIAAFFAIFPYVFFVVLLHFLFGWRREIF